MIKVQLQQDGNIKISAEDGQRGAYNFVLDSDGAVMLANALLDGAAKSEAQAKKYQEEQKAREKEAEKKQKEDDGTYKMIGINLSDDVNQ